ncbi:MAG: GxxExxY protein [Bacteriodetes bacterium]|nr:GxxExxY protein [Bacteroidota bacterium]
MNENEISKVIFDFSLKIHRTLGPGLLESAYESCLYYELHKAGFTVSQQKPLPLVYEDVMLEAGYRVDLLVENSVIIEVKSVDKLAPVHFAQVLTYLKFSNCKLGILVNFNEFLLKDGFKRVVNKL